MDIITGKWTGNYIYGESYVDELRGKSVPFTMELFFEGEILRGTCVDEETKDLFGQPSTIEGSFENGFLLFYKSYPEAKDLVGERLLLAKGYNSTSIQYKGNLRRNFGQVKGILREFGK